MTQLVPKLTTLAANGTTWLYSRRSIFSQTVSLQFRRALRQMGYELLWASGVTSPTVLGVDGLQGGDLPASLLLASLTADRACMLPAEWGVLATYLELADLLPALGFKVELATHPPTGEPLEPLRSVAMARVASLPN